MTFDQFFAAVCIYREMRGESSQSRLACYWVIVNRSKDSRWPQTLYEVITQRLQFSSFNSDDPQVTLWPKLTDPVFNSICNMVENPGLDPTNGANAYEALEEGQPRPSWAKNPIMQIGKTRFYKL